MSPFLGLDYGLQRIGIAVSDATDTLATPLQTHERDAGSFFTYLDRIIAEREISGVVLGLPMETSGGEGDLAARVREFARKIAEHTGLPVHLEDERYSSQEAAGWLRLGGRKRRPKAELDALAAALILQQYLDRRAGGDDGECESCED